MRIGYCCLTVGVPHTAQRTTIAKNATPERLEELIAHNLDVLQRILQYNLSQGIRVFRISSDIIPFGSSPVNTLDWPRMFRKKLAQIGSFARENGMRLSMHPGQYTVINSPNEDVVQRAYEDLRYHTTLLDAMGMGQECKIVLHVGGVYGDRPAALARFAQSYRRLPAEVRARLVIENDDKMYTAAEVLQLAQKLGLPMVFDNLHNAVLPSARPFSEAEWIAAAGETWGGMHGRQKVHYSQQAAGQKAGSHSKTIYIQPFLQYAASLSYSEIDIMLEVKDKNLSAVKCVLCTAPNGHIKALEREWAKYKYTVLEHSQSSYNAIRVLLKDKAAYPAVDFYELLEEAGDTPVQQGSAVNAAQHVWGYVKDRATAGEKASFEKAVAAYTDGAASLARVKSLLRRLCEKYGADYPLNSYYFAL